MAAPKLIYIVDANAERRVAAIDRALGGIPAAIELAHMSEPPRDRLDEVSGLISSSWKPTGEELPALRWLQTFNAGHEDIEPALLAREGLQVCHGSGPAAVPMAEWTIAAMLFFAHRLGKILHHQTGRTWYENRQRDMSANPLFGRRVGILGYGAIGRQVARLCTALGMQVVASFGREEKRQLPTYMTPGTGDPDGRLPADWFRLEDAAEVLPRLDYVVLALRVNEQTEGLVDRAFLDACQTSAVLINMARGGLVDEGALADALHTGAIAGAALDVFQQEPLPGDHPLRDAPNMLLSPHCSPESALFQEEINRMVAENLRRFGVAEQLLNVIRPR